MNTGANTSRGQHRTEYINETFDSQFPRWGNEQHGIGYQTGPKVEFKLGTLGGQIDNQVTGIIELGSDSEGFHPGSECRLTTCGLAGVRWSGI
jgi:hypothetical protein